MKKKLVVGLAVGVMMLGMAAQASAAVIEYTDMAAFNAAVTGEISYNFEGIAPPNSWLFGNVTVGGVEFSDNYSDNYPFVIDANAGLGNYGASFFSGQSADLNIPSYVTATPLAGVTAIGFFYGSYISSSTPFTVTFSTGDIFNLTTPVIAGFETGFVGFTSDSPISSVTFALPQGAMDITQFISANATPTPIPGAFWLLGSGLAGLIGARRKKK